MAYGTVVGLLTLLVTYHVLQIARGPTPEVSTVSPSGLITTTLASSPNYPLHILMIAICAALLVKLIRAGVLVEFHRPPGS